MDTSNICMICLGNREKLISIGEINSSEICLRVKLEKCVPELNWMDSYEICLNCCEQLKNAYNFRELCLKSEKARFELWEKLTHLQTENKQIIKLAESLNTPEYYRCDIKTEEETPAGFSNFINLRSEEQQNIESKENLDSSKDDKSIINTEKDSNTDSSSNCIKKLSNGTIEPTCINIQNGKFKDLFCKYCCTQYTDEKLFIIHEKTCVPIETKNNLNDCKDRSVETEHNEDKIQLGGNANKCDVCGTLFNNKYLLKRHKKNVHATEKNFKCDQCPSTFVSLVYLNAHKKYHSGDRKHVCSFCGKRYITASDLYHHEKIHANKRAYKCEECKKAFNTSSDLHKHKICVHMDRSLWKYSCEYCLRQFPLKINLDNHIKTHTGEKNFSCHLCDKKCISRSALVRHIESHTNIKSFKCNFCNLSYKYKKSLEFHIVKKHGIGNAKVPEKVKKYFCHLCPKRYYANSKLEKHIRSHTGDKPFKCPTCSKCFVDKSYIKQHLRIAHNQNV
ncbi:zinc finger protein OZF-like [Harmonia axyridis]|uniref:zinc finger protein OZF-like n=1 Tax=Harmonia axyridis TaxID=115357 RepID=UPI001E275B47|nr:zinc finger protein OZF-like [Harmonia axyridis]